MRTRNTSSSKLSTSSTGKKILKKEEIQCFNCGELGHRSTMCGDKNKGTKCFRCNRFGHKLFDCKREKPKKMKEITDENTRKAEAVNSLSASKSMYKTIEVKGKKFNALIDTGSQFNIMNESSHNIVS